MSRHVADRQSETESGRLKHFAEVERQHRPDGSHPALRQLHERPADREGAGRLREFTRIERGWTA
ncbi:MAG: hypothetical protein R3D97_05675 [Paracoccaceae bacterium]